jgi:hypothetical protein
MGLLCLLISTDWGDLPDILSLQKLLRDICVIIILTGREDESVRIGYKLKPRCLTYVNGDVSEVHAVLPKCLCSSKDRRGKADSKRFLQGEL